MALIDDIRTALDGLSDDRINAAIQQVDEQKFSRQREPLDFDTAIERLLANRGVLQGALATGFLATVPPAIQREMLPLLAAIATAVAALVDGEDRLDRLVSDVDKLDSLVWRNGIVHAPQLAQLPEGLSQLGSLTAETDGLKTEVSNILAQAAEMPTLAQQARDAASATAEAQTAAEAARAQTAPLAEQASQAASAAADAQQQAQSALETANQSSQQSQQAAAAATDALQKAQTAQEQAAQLAQQAQDALTEARLRNETVDTLLGQAQSSRQQIIAFEEDLKALYDQAQQFRAQIAETVQEAQTTITATREGAEETLTHNTARTDALLQQLEANEERIEDALQKATGVSLFHSFQERKNRLARGKWIWAGAVGLLAIGFVMFISYVISTSVMFTSERITPALYLKLSFAIPIGLLIWFCMVQYNRERRLEEEYAFKSNLSLSLVPYRELVAKVTATGDEATREKHAQFLIDSVEEIFTPPADQRPETDLTPLKSLRPEQLKQFAELLAQMTHIALQGKK